ncbi:hypothetical protein RCH14_004783 [Massilia sp. MP_M2]|uniref:hypothetical protein n=1 Tax=Massilia sp. MP_M2 TaxID=3071713 RepID=UPI00319DD199
MGEANRRGPREKRIAEAQARDAALDVELKSKPAYSPMDWILAGQPVNALFNNLTTPTSIDSNVETFAKMLSEKEPMFLSCEPELWSKQSCCDMNVEKYIEKHGGKMLCGYRIWYNTPDYIEGERHAVWTDGTDIRDVSFSDTGEQTILFVPDNHTFVGAPRKVRHTFIKSLQGDLAKFDEVEQGMFQQMSAEKSWEIMPTYEQWKSGVRSANMFAQFS